MLTGLHNQFPLLNFVQTNVKLPWRVFVDFLFDNDENDEKDEKDADSKRIFQVRILSEA